jgi:CrcB protein
VKNFLVVGLGGFLGAMARYGVSLAVASFWTRDLPLATFLINISGSFVLGFFTTMAAERVVIAPEWRLLVGTGFVGAYTTFLTFEYETQRLVELGAKGWALANVLASVTAGFLAVRLGMSLSR